MMKPPLPRVFMTRRETLGWTSVGPHLVLGVYHFTVDGVAIEPILVIHGNGQLLFVPLSVFAAKSGIEPPRHGWRLTTDCEFSGAHQAAISRWLNKHLAELTHGRLDAYLAHSNEECGDDCEFCMEEDDE